MKRKLAVFLATVFIFTCCINVQFQVPSRPRLAIAAILIGAALISLAVAARQTPKEVSDVR